MPDEQTTTPGGDQGESKAFCPDIPFETPGFFLRGSANYDWGMKNRLSRIFNPKSGRTVMLAFDHGYIMGPTTGLERIDLNIVPLCEHVDVLMCTRGVLRSCIPPSITKPVALRCSAGATILKDLSYEHVGVDIDDAIRLDAAAMAVQVYIGGEHEHATLENLTKTIDAGNRYGIPTLGVTAVGREMARDARYLGLACRIIAELGAHYIKTYYCEPDFEQVTAACPVPIVIAGGKKLPELDALKMCYNAVQQGAAGVDMGRNIFQAANPVAMVKAVSAVVHELTRPEDAYAEYLEAVNAAK